MKTIHFISGLPRSGSTLLANILAQNPRFQATATSGILEILVAVRNTWDKVYEFRAAVDRAADDATRVRVLRGILESYHASGDRPIVFDKSRGWLAYLEMTELILGRPARVLVTVRDLRDVLASFERLWRASASSHLHAAEGQNPHQFATVEGRCEFWAGHDQAVGLAYNRIKDALHRGFADRMRFVRFADLTERPGPTLASIYEFLGEPAFAGHDFERVEQVTAEDDRVYGFADLHTIRRRVEPVPPAWPHFLGDAALRYEGWELW